MTLQQDVDVLRKIPLFAKIEPARLKLLAFTSEHVSSAPERPSVARVTRAMLPISCSRVRRMWS